VDVTKDEFFSLPQVQQPINTPPIHTETISLNNSPPATFFEALTRPKPLVNTSTPVKKQQGQGKKKTIFIIVKLVKENLLNKHSIFSFSKFF